MNRRSEWSWGKAPGYVEELHGGLPYQLDKVPLWIGSARLVGYNVTLLRSHADWLQHFVDQATTLTPGFHPGFRIEADKIPDAAVIPPRVRFPAELAMAKLTGLTASGKAPKFPLEISFTIDGSTRVDRKGNYHKEVGSKKHDECIGHISYLADGQPGKAAIHCWRGHVRWSVECVQDGQTLKLARIERADLSGDTVRHYDYRK